MQRGGQPGNTNGTKKHQLWGDTLRRAIAQDDGKTMRKAAEALLKAAADGDIAAIKELADRLDGKAHQTIATPEGQSLVVEIVRYGAQIAGEK